MSDDQEPEGVKRITDKMAEMFVGENLGDIMMALSNMAIFSCVRFSNNWYEAEEKRDALVKSFDIIMQAYRDEDPSRYDNFSSEKDTLQ